MVINYNLKLIEVKNMEREKLKHMIFYFDVFFLIFGIIFLFLNLEVVSVIHANASDWLPVLVYKTYSALGTSLLYIFIFLVITDILSFKIRFLKPFKPYIISLIPVVTTFSLVLLFLNPHAIILNPSGSPPTWFDEIELGGIITIILFIGFTIVSIIQIYLDRILKTYFLPVLFIIGGLLISDLIHEGGHAVITLLVGGEVEAFYPFPVLLGRELVAGYVGFSNVPSNFIPLVLLGGEIFQWTTVSIILIILYFKPNYRKNVFILTLLFVGLLDFPLYTINNAFGLPHWFFIGSTNGDIILFSELTGVTLWFFIVLACCQLLITCLIIYKLIFKNRKEKIKEELIFN